MDFQRSTCGKPDFYTEKARRDTDTYMQTHRQPLKLLTDNVVFSVNSATLQQSVAIAGKINKDVAIFFHREANIDVQLKLCYS